MVANAALHHQICTSTTEFEFASAACDGMHLVPACETEAGDVRDRFRQPDTGVERSRGALRLGGRQTRFFSSCRGRHLVGVHELVMLQAGDRHERDRNLFGRGLEPPLSA
jgi:hypothetical protein